MREALAAARSSLATARDTTAKRAGPKAAEAVPITVKAMRDSYNAKLTMPVINGEVNYEGIMATCRDDVQRIIFF